MISSGRPKERLRPSEPWMEGAVEVPLAAEQVAIARVEAEQVEAVLGLKSERVESAAKDSTSVDSPRAEVEEVAKEEDSLPTQVGPSGLRVALEERLLHLSLQLKPRESILQEVVKEEALRCPVLASVRERAVEQVVEELPWLQPRRQCVGCPRFLFSRIQQKPAPGGPYCCESSRALVATQRGRNRGGRRGLKMKFDEGQVETRVNQQHL